MTPAVLRLSEVAEQTYRVTQPEEAAEGRDVVFSGQLIAQMLMASDRAAEGKDVRSVHAVFARAGTYTKAIDLQVDSMHAGRTWASDNVSAMQDGRLLARALVLLNGTDPDLVRHGPDMPEGIPSPETLCEGPWQTFPGAEVRPVPAERVERGVPVQWAWHRYQDDVGSQAACRAVLVWATCGNSIGLAMRPHRDSVDISQAHRTLSTGVIAHTAHFLEPFDVSQWLLIETRAESAGGGRVYASGSVFSEDGFMVATFQQDSMARGAYRQLDRKRAL